MLKTFLIGIKDLRLAFRDRAALILMLAAPFVLTVGLGLVTGRFSGNTNSGIADIPVIVVNLDKEQLGNALADVFTSAELADLLEPAASSDPEAARKLIDEDKAAAVVIIPAGFTRSIIPQQGDFSANAVAVEPVKIEVYANPTRPTGAGIIKAIVDEFLSRVEEGRISGATSIVQTHDERTHHSLAGRSRRHCHGRTNAANSPSNALAIKINSSTANGETTKFDALAYIAPAMALMFLMYTVTYGGRSILAERAQGTLPRLLVSPTNTAQILGGKVFGIFLTGAAQMLILIGASSLFFQLKWGDPLGVIVLVFAAVIGATGWGMIITATRTHTKSGGKRRHSHHADLRHHGRKFHQLEQMPVFMQMFQQDHTQRLGIGWIYNIGTRRDIERSFRADHCPAFNGHDPVFGFCRTIRQKEFGAEMKKIFAIAWKDAIIRFSSSSELIFFIILPLIFTFLLAGGTPKADGGDQRIRLVVVDQAHTTISQNIIAELEKSTAVRPETLTWMKPKVNSIRAAHLSFWYSLRDWICKPFKTAPRKLTFASNQTT